jgi:hypothetical protein
MLKIRYRPLVATLVLTSLAGWGVALAVTSAGAGRIKGFEGVQVAPSGAPDSACTSSDTFVPLPAMSLPFELTHDGRIVMLFQGQFGGGSSTADARAIIRFTIDGAIAGSAVAVGNDHGDGLQTFGYNSFSAPLEQGPHTLEVQWHTFPSGATSCVEERSLIILRP